ncbi:MAG: class I SAM-dependent methyltransferase [Candidatus Aminicenantes bacterium]|nr:MAG: class I SAM-dependent methyltransferase [Candidatus Aminicenantes bacterium]
MIIMKRQIKRILFGLLSSFVFVILSTAGLQQKRPEVPYVPTPEEVVVEMLSMANVSGDDVVYDLGCGDGRIVITAAKELGCRGVGIDIDLTRIQESRVNASNAGVSDRVEFLHMDLFEADISQASVVTLYLLSRVNLRLRPKLFQELKPGTRVVSHDFSMGEWTPDKSTVIEERVDYVPLQDTRFIDDYWNKHSVHFWIIPANVSGTWKLTVPTLSREKPYRLEIDQNFQMLKGKAYEGSVSLPLDIRNGKINGDRLEFFFERKNRGRTEKMHFEGIVKDHDIVGFVRIEGKPDFEEKWHAKRDPSTKKSIEE